METLQKEMETLKKEIRDLRLFKKDALVIITNGYNSASAFQQEVKKLVKVDEKRLNKQIN
jgi:hypothetical protein